MDAETLAAIQATANEPRNAYTPCAWPGCTRTVAGGTALIRVNPKGQPGIWMCRDDAKVYTREVAGRA